MSKNKYNNYITPLDIPTAKSGKWQVKKEIIPRGTYVMLNNTRNYLFGQRREAKEVSYDHETVRHQLLESKSRWMSDWPVEIAQTVDCLKGMKGRVLVGGLGLGLALSYLMQKKTVTYITVVELEADVIKLVGPYVKNQWVAGKGHKYNIVQMDLLKFLDGQWTSSTFSKKAFDYAFYDIWASDGEGTFHNTVVPLLNLSKGVVKNRPVCWNEDIMRGQLAMGLHGRLLYLQHPEMRPSGWRDPWEDCPAAGPYWQWAVPFWKWWNRKKIKPTNEEFSDFANTYARHYGNPYDNSPLFIKEFES